jgi:hypothetical protein
MKDNQTKRPGDYQTNLLIYRLLGMPFFKRMIMGSVGKFVLLFNPREKMPSYFIGQPYKIESLKLTIKWLYFNEVVHLLFTLISIVIGYFFWKKGNFSGVGVMIGLFVLNFGLVLLQRYNRAKIYRIINALEKRKVV